MKRIAILLLTVLVLAGLVWARGRGLTYHRVQVVDENGREVTDVNDVWILSPGTDTAQTVYNHWSPLRNDDPNAPTDINMPAGLATRNTTLANGHFHWYGADAFDIKVTSTSMGSVTVRGLNRSTGRIELPRYMPQLAGLAWVTVELTNADIKALRATPKELVPAPGAGYIIEPVEAVLILDYGTNVLTESADNLIIGWNAGAVPAGEVVEATGFIDQSADTITTWHMAKDEINAASTIANKNLSLKNNGDGEFAGNAAADTTMTVSILYRTIATGL